MARRKRSSRFLAPAGERIVGLKHIDPDLDLGAGLGVLGLMAERDKLQSQIDRFNTLTVELDEVGGQVKQTEKNIKTMMSRILSAVRARYGADSKEYEQAGGVRSSERKRRSTKDDVEK